MDSFTKNKPMKTAYSFIAALATVALAACTGSNEWTLRGTITDAGTDAKVYLEAPTMAGWAVTDSASVDAHGAFLISQPAPATPEVYRLRYDNREIYFPIDSVETVSLQTTASGFGSDFDLTGSPRADRMTQLNNLVNRYFEADTATRQSIKQQLAEFILTDPADIISYYLVQKRHNGQPVLDPTNKADIRLIGAVANAYDQARPNDPRTIYLRRLFLSNRTVSGAAPSVEIPVDEINYFDIDLIDRNGKHNKLSDAVKANRAVVLSFTAYSAENSPALNLELNKIYEQYHPKGVEIYQVAVDPDELTWRQSAVNLPWITVYQSPSSPASNLTNYNVQAIPSTFVIVNGDITARTATADELRAALNRAL